MRHRPIFSLEKPNEAAAYLEEQLKRISARATKDKDKSKIREAAIKREMLVELIDEASQINPRETKLFVSLAGNFRDKHIGPIQRACIGAGFSEVFTGFDPDVGDHGDLKSEIMFKVAAAHAFLGIWSDDFHLGRARNNSVPRVWMPLELGMALILDKPFHLILHKNTERSYLSPVQDLVQGWYNDDRSLDHEVGTAAKRLLTKVNARRDQASM